MHRSEDLRMKLTASCRQKSSLDPCSFSSLLRRPLHHLPFAIRELAMELLVSVVVTDLLGRALSMVIRRCWQPRGAEHKLQRLLRVLLQVDAMVEEAEGRHITNQAMLQQLEMLRQGMYSGHYMLDTFRYRGHRGEDEVSNGRHPIVALSRFRSSRQILDGNQKDQQNTVVGTESLNKLEKMVDDLETMISDMKEFAMFLEGYPHIYRQPYSAYLVLDRVMFGRQMEEEKIISFLLWPEADGKRKPGVLPIIGPARVGKSTLVEHVCLDERVHGYFSPIVFFSRYDLGVENLAALRHSGVIKHQDLAAASHGRLLVIIELTRDMDKETWRRFYYSAASNMGHGSKIIITSRSEKMVALGTTEALRLKFLPQEAYWYYFKTLAFGSTKPEDQPKLASLGMEIAVLLNGSFLGANIVAGLMRANLNSEFWRRVLQCLGDFTSKHLLMFSEHPSDRLRKG
ncbi:hypothetical protein ACP4OV_024557 [Aristida adscensionis]